MTEEKKVPVSEHLTMQLPLVFEPETGTVYMLLQNVGMMALGNTKTGEVRVTRVYRPGELDPGAPVPEVVNSPPVGWTLGKLRDEDGNEIDITPQQLAYQALMLNTNLIAESYAPYGMQVKEVFDSLEVNVLPMLVEREKSGGDILNDAAGCLLRWRQGLLSSAELASALEIITTWVSMVPEQFLQMRPTLREEAPAAAVDRPSGLILPPGMRSH